MSPRGAVLALSIASSLTLSALTLLAPVVALSLIALGVVGSVLLNHGYARALGSTRRPLSRAPLDRLVAVEVALAFAPPLAVLALLEAGVLGGFEVDALWAASVGVTAGVMTVCFLSSLVDWYYVLPRRDGLVGSPPCRAPEENRWKRVTWFWFLHRLVAAAATIGGVYAIAICLGLWLNERYPDFSGGVGGTVAVLFAVVSYFARSYLAHIGHVWQRLYSPGAAMGEHLETTVAGRSVTGYVFNVSIERVDLLRQNDVLTHASHEALATHCDHNHRTALCAKECVRGNAEVTGNPPTGGHGGCLFGTEEKHLEKALGRGRLFVF
ncbi:MAG: hypothetical protein M3335_04400 [Actinomycetota bacterium]|nr:hypothetical protein [Actinomycetota bacterium]